MVESSNEFDALLARVRDGDVVALSELIQRYESKVRAVARAMLGPNLRRHLDSVDVAQSVHLALVVGLRGNRFRFNDEDAFLALLVTLVRRKVARKWRRLRKEGATAVDRSGPTDAMDARADAAPDARLRVQDELDRVWPSLSLAERHLIELRLLGLSTAEAAVEMGVAANVLRVLLSRLRGRLRDQGLFDDWL